MKLIRIENINTGETHYFTRITHASEFINESFQAVKYAAYGDSEKPFKREWKISFTEDPDVKNGNIVK